MSLANKELTNLNRILTETTFIIYMSVFWQSMNPVLFEFVPIIGYLEHDILSEIKSVRNFYARLKVLDDGQKHEDESLFLSMQR